MIWANTTTNKLNMREGSATFIVGDWGVADLGHIRQDGTNAFTANFDGGGFRLTNLAAASGANDAYRNAENTAQMHATTGHAHTGIAGDASKISYLNAIDQDTVPKWIFFTSALPSIALMTASTSSTTFDASSDVSPDDADMLVVAVTCLITTTSTTAAVGGAVTLNLEPTGSAGTMVSPQYRLDIDEITANGTHAVQFAGQYIVPCDASNQIDYGLTDATSASTISVQLSLQGYLRKAT